MEGVPGTRPDQDQDPDLTDPGKKGEVPLAATPVIAVTAMAATLAVAVSLVQAEAATPAEGPIQAKAATPAEAATPAGAAGTTPGGTLAETRAPGGGIRTCLAAVAAAAL